MKDHHFEQLVIVYYIKIISFLYSKGAKWVGTRRAILQGRLAFLARWPAFDGTIVEEASHNAAKDNTGRGMTMRMKPIDEHRHTVFTACIKAKVKGVLY